MLKQKVFEGVESAYGDAFSALARSLGLPPEDEMNRWAELQLVWHRGATCGKWRLVVDVLQPEPRQPSRQETVRPMVVHPTVHHED